MPRPEIKDKELWATWEEFSQEQALKLSSHPGLQKAIKEVTLAGCYLASTLVKLKCPPDIIEKICYSAGQRSFRKDPWEVVERAIGLYKAGTWEEPGPELAEKINEENFGSRKKSLYEKLTKKRT